MWSDVSVWTTERQLGVLECVLPQETPEDAVNQPRLWGRCGCCWDQLYGPVVPSQIRLVWRPAHDGTGMWICGGSWIS